MLRRKCNVQSIEAYENKSLLCVVPHLVPSNKVSNKRIMDEKRSAFHGRPCYKQKLVDFPHQ